MLSGPSAAKIDSAGNIYISDYQNNRIRKVNVITGIISTIVGNGTGAFYGDGGPAVSAEIWGASDICLDKLGNLYISDNFNKRIRKVNTLGIISTFAGNGGFSALGTGDGGPDTAATFNNLSGIVADDTGNIYIADMNAGKVRKVDTEGIITTIAGNGTLTYSIDGILAIDASISPVELAINDSNELIIADKYNRRIYKIDHAGILHWIAGNGATGYNGDGIPATSASLDFPSGVSVDPCGNLYITEANNKRVRKVIFDTIPPAFTVALSPGDTVCAGAPVTCNATITRGKAISYQWYVNGIPIVAATSSAYTYTPLSGDSVRCVLIAALPCNGAIDTVSSSTVYIVTDTVTIPSISLLAPASVHVGNIVTVNAIVANAGSSYIINWYNNSLLFNTTTAPVVTYVKSTGTDNITATVIPIAIGTSAGCYDSVTSQVYSVTATGLGVATVGMPQVYLYPNPAYDAINIAAQNIVNVTISNGLGQSLINKNVNTDHIRIDLESLPTGVYTVKVICGDGQKVIRKIVKE